MGVGKRDKRIGHREDRNTHLQQNEGVWSYGEGLDEPTNVDTSKVKQIAVAAIASCDNGRNGDEADFAVVEWATEEKGPVDIPDEDDVWSGVTKYLRFNLPSKCAMVLYIRVPIILGMKRDKTNAAFSKGDPASII